MFFTRGVSPSANILHLADLSPAEVALRCKCSIIRASKMRRGSSRIHQKQRGALWHSFAFGGSEGSRTPVRKPLDTTFYERRQSIEIPIGRSDCQDRPQVAILCVTVTMAKSPFTFTADLTLSPKPRYSSEERVAYKPQHRLRGQSYSIVSVYYLIGQLKSYPALLAYHILKSPSKPLRTRNMRTELLYYILPPLSSVFFDSGGLFYCVYYFIFVFYCLDFSITAYSRTLL